MTKKAGGFISDKYSKPRLLFLKRHDIRHNDNRHNNSQLNDIQHHYKYIEALSLMAIVFMLGVIFAE